MKGVVIARVVQNLLNGCGSYCDIRSVSRRVQIILYVRILCMSVRGTFVQRMIHIIWRKYVHRYAPYIRTTSFTRRKALHIPLSSTTKASNA